MSSTKQLGRLERVTDLRSVWESESEKFTPWLADENNLALLGDTIGLELDLETQEKDVGPFRADILCRETANNSWVVIENQLERTDHSHLGQILTYAAGLKAVTVVWIAERFTDEHQATLEWLNEITEDDFSFFGLEIELWRIGDSPIAPKFNIVAKPNEWTKGKITKKTSEQLTPAKELQLEFWTSFREYLQENSKIVRPQKPLPQHWMNLAIGTSRAHVYAFVDTRLKRIGARLQITDPSDRLAIFNILNADREEIEEEFGVKLQWEEKPDKKSSYVTLSNTDADPYKKDDWLEQHKWLLKTLESFKTVFGQRIKNINPEQWEPAVTGENTGEETVQTD